MPVAQITNPSGAHKTVTDFVTYKAADGSDLQYGQTVEEFVASDAILANDWVAFVAAATAAPLKVEKLDVSDAQAANLCAGVALEGAAAGEIVRVCREGITLCNIGDTGAIAAGDVAIKHATADGCSGVTAFAAVDATTILGTVLGVYLGPEVGTTNKAPVNVHKM